MAKRFEKLDRVSVRKRAPGHGITERDTTFERLQAVRVTAIAGVQSRKKFLNRAGASSV